MLLRAITDLRSFVQKTKVSIILGRALATDWKIEEKEALLTQLQRLNTRVDLKWEEIISNRGYY